MFADRTAAGEALADRLIAASLSVDVVLAIPRGGLPVARPVADALGVPLDVVIARKMGAPGNAELAIGAVADDGTTWVNESLVGALDVSDAYLEGERRREQELAREAMARYRPSTLERDFVGQRVLIVDDGLATGATMHACVDRIKAAGATSVLIAVPVAAPETAASLERVADEVIALREPRPFGAVGQYYRDFSQVSDAAALALLDRSP